MNQDKTPCLLLMNDMHVSREDVAAFERNWAEALELCAERGIRQIALGGDLFQSRTAQTLDVLLAVHDALLAAHRAGIRVTLAEGNHDLVDQEALRGYCHVFDQHPNVAVVDDFLTLEDPAWDFALHMMSYFPEDGSFTSRLQALVMGGLAEGKLNYLYIHEGVNGALSTPAPQELPAHIFDRFDRVFAGHYHNRVVVPGTRIEYIGSSRQFNFGEDEEKGYTILCADGSAEFVRNRVNQRYRTLDVTAAEVDVPLFDRIDEMRDEGRCRIRVRVAASATDTVDKRRLLEAGAGKVEVLVQDAPTVQAPEEDVLEKYDSARLRHAYGEFCTARSIDQSLGMSYLKKIDSPCGI
ncbi:metallophosphoesterase family protein [Alistipes indistinctus]|uniref:metallophosphoesterase family protein n=1 Tax=Alistipes indistinctus TaxID=626932 RepID=UPI003EFEA904